MPKSSRSKKKNTKKKNKNRTNNNLPPRNSHLTPTGNNLPESNITPDSPPVLLPIEAPRSNKDPRFLGKGASKMIWLMYPDKEMDEKQLPRMNKVIVNAYNSQLLEDQRGTEDEIIARRIKEQQNEFYFTRMVREVFPDLIPEVYELIQDIYLPQPRFRYTKDRCERLPKNNELFHHMIRISDRIIDQGWVYLDMKPGNLGLLEGQVLLIDTDPASFYRIPRMSTEAQREKVQRFYRINCHMIILLVCVNYVKEMDIQVLQDFIQSKGYTSQIFSDIYNTAPISSASIAHHNNHIATHGGYPVHLEPREIMHPTTYINHYGNFKGVPALKRLQQIIEY